MNEYDAAYEGTQGYFGAPSPLLTEHLDLIPEGARVLDIGVGQGRNAMLLAERGCSVTGIDPSSASIEQTAAAAAAAGVEMELFRLPAHDYFSEEKYDVVLCFGLMQILSRADCASLVHRIYDWTRHGSVLYLTAWHVDDPSYDRISDAWEKVGLHSFRSPDGEYRTYLARGVIRNLFRSWKTVHHHEGMGALHRHGDGEEHRHGDIELVAVRRSSELG
jgi:cyclopropane fatty-acyl-phospholipid synthase-like methyltransferase